MKNITIEKYQTGQEIAIHQLIKKVYDEFVAKDYSDEGNQYFYDWIEPSKIAARQKKQTNLFVALVDSKLVGMIEIRDNKNISLLFVDKEYQGVGIAKKLFSEALKNCIQRDSTLNMFYVHASPYSVPIYQKLGFRATNTMQEQFGIHYLPMGMRVTL